MALTAAAWLAAVRRRGGTVRVDERRRIGISPRSALTPELRAAVPALRAAIIRRLLDARTFPCPRCQRPLLISRRADPDFTVCVCCKVNAIEARRRRA